MRLEFSDKMTFGKMLELLKKMDFKEITKIRFIDNRVIVDFK